VITHAASGRSTTYGKVADAAARLEAPKDVPLKDPKTWTIAGKPLPRLDTADKVDGRKVYGIDLKLPGMLNAAVKACPVLLGGKLKGFDAASVAGKPGVRKVIAVGDNAVAVVADTWWQAKTALDALKIDWDLGPNAKASSADTAAMLREGLDAKEAFEGNKTGDVDAAMATAAKKVEATYSVPHQHHVTMEPMNATARWNPALDRVEVWCPTQNGESALATAAAASGLPPAQVRGLSHRSRRRLRPSRHQPRLRASGGDRRQGVPGHADQADLVARGGHAPRLVPPGDDCAG
jgi:isoquinoline 1-oxidoreductase subunit beta